MSTPGLGTAKPLSKYVTADSGLRPRSLGTKSQKTSYRTELSTASSIIDFVIVFRPTNNIERSAEALQQLLQKLAGVGLLVQVRPGCELGEVMLLVKCPTDRLQREVHSSRSRDWLSGIRVAAPGIEQSVDGPPITDGERLRLVFMIITAPEDENGAGITPKLGSWINVESIFPLHNKEFDQAWLKTWATRWRIDDKELEHICEHFGTKVAMYFAFLQFYFISLSVPAALGIVSFFLLPEYSVIYSICVSLWAIVFHGLWERRQRQLAIRWDVRNCSQMEHRRAAFVGSHQITNPRTGSQVPAFNDVSRLARESLAVPFALLAGSFLAAVLTLIFAVEVFIGEVYDGPLKSILTFTPTVLFSILVGPFSSLYMQAAHKLTTFENHETDAKFNAAITRKSFILNFLTSYTALFLTLFVYLPLGHLLVPKLDVFGLTSTYAAYGVTAKPFVLDNGRIRNQLFYFAVTAQIVNLFMEFILPIVLRLAKGEAQELQAKFTGQSGFKPTDAPEEVALMKQIRFEARLPDYDTYGDFAELVIQFGYTVMFSSIWPLTPVCAFLNNIIELRADAAKLCKNMKRPVPMRADTIGPWADNIVFLTWLGSMTTASITFLLGGDAPATKSFLHLLAVCFFSEHVYVLLCKSVSVILARLPNAAERKVQDEEFLIRKEYLSKLSSVESTTTRASVSLKNILFQEDFSEICTHAYRIVRQKAGKTPQKKEL